MYQQIAIVVACLVGLSQASYLAAPPALPLAAPVLAAPSFTTSAHVGNVQSVSRSFSNVPQTRFTRTDWNQPGSLITSPVFSPIISPVLGQIAVPGPTRYDSYLVPRPPLVENLVSHIPGVAHVPTYAAVPAAVPVAAPLPAPLPAYGAPLPVAAPVAVKGY
ncbi:hypothetical protein SUGI_1507290 [Cryptomeria japonica]|uniref:Uncharacterized protein n=1 Tax=Cryptomeria japonica TaxID=3369 RepID=A0AAD3NP78_CRYJA|nr:hypothetical protein SUGI_1507290 [Cryptomeria japonica]